MMPWIIAYNAQYDLLYQSEVSEETAIKAGCTGVTVHGTQQAGIPVRPRNLSEWPEMRTQMGITDAKIDVGE